MSGNAKQRRLSSRKESRESIFTPEFNKALKDIGDAFSILRDSIRRHLQGENQITVATVEKSTTVLDGDGIGVRL